MHYKRFEDVPVWESSRVLIGDLYKLIYSSCKFKKDYVLVSQLKRATYSIMLNIAEGFERGSNSQFANFLNIAKGSAGEVRSVLYIALDSQYINQADFDIFYLKLENISQQLSNFRKFLLINYARKK
jgi:four helix bundle protein